MIDCIKADVFPANGSAAAKVAWIKTHGVVRLLSSLDEGLDLHERIHEELGVAVRRISLSAAIELARLIGISSKSCRNGEYRAAVTSLQMVLVDLLGKVFQEELE